jgi:hypothetical protein
MRQKIQRLRAKNEVIPISNENEIGETVHNDSPLVLLDDIR